MNAVLLRRRALIGVIAAVLVATGATIVWVSRDTADDARARMAALPGHFSFGVANASGAVGSLDAMRDQNGTAWTFRYQYLSGGVNTGHDWTSWALPPGRFARAYLDESAQHGYLPVFVYYQLLQSDGPCPDCDEPRRDLANLADAGVMRVYFENWALLMKELGAHAGAVVVIVEPDLWGYIEQAALRAGDGPAAITASVASSGLAETAGLPDSAQGFAWALLRFRDRYAPNALLALHASPFGTGVDVSSSADRDVDAVAVGAQEADFLRAMGIGVTPPGSSTFDLITSDVANRDAEQSGIWWDPDNVAYPNFARYLEFAAALSAGTARRILMWQVPVGNQQFRTLDGTRGHTQDNRAEYIVSHVSDLAAAGIIGVLFGSGTDGTSIDDAVRDGVTNPPPSRTARCDACNTRLSAHADDDGGFLRLAVGAYYRGGSVPLPVGLPASKGHRAEPGCEPRVSLSDAGSAPVSAVAGTTVRLNVRAAATCPVRAVIDFEVYGPHGDRVWQGWVSDQLLGAEPRSVATSWTLPVDLASGSYVVKVGAFRAGWGGLYAWEDDALRLLVSGRAGCASAPRIGFGTMSGSAVVARGGMVELRLPLTASCPINALVDYEIFGIDGQRVWQRWVDNRVLDTSPTEVTMRWEVPPDLPPGEYTVKVGVFRAGWHIIYGWQDHALTLRVTPGR